MSERTVMRFRDLLELAAARGICVPAFDSGAGRPEFVRAVLEVCRRHESAALFISWTGSAKRFGFRAIVALVRALASETGVPAALHLDHANEEADIRAAIEAGFGSVMFDGAPLDLEENVKRTRAVVEHAHASGVAVEASLGTIGRERSGEGAQELTDPARASQFVEETGIDILAPSVGNRHGCRGHTVPLDWALIEELGRRVRIPMALHGGSGVAIEDVRRAAGHGFRKLNLATMLHGTYSEAVKAHIRDNPDHGWGRWANAGQKALETVVERYVTELDMQGTARAW